jgi:hypothetical protein
MLAVVLSVCALLWCSVLTYASQTEDLFLTLSDENDAIFQAEHIIITDINQVICWYRGATASSAMDWYHQFDERRFRRKNSIPSKTDSRNFGWYSGEQTTSSQYKQLKLLKDVTYVPVEDFFFCDPDRNNNDNNYISIGIYYPSEFA